MSNGLRVTVSVRTKIADRLIPTVQVGCVLASAWFVWIHHILPRLGLEPLTGIAVEAFLYVAIAWICGAFIAFWVYFVVSLAELPHAARFSLRTSAPAMWFAPAVVLLPAPVPGAFGASLFLVAAATLQLIAQWGLAESPVQRKEPAYNGPAPLFRTAGSDAAFLSRNSLPVLMGSFTAQLGLVALLWGYRLRAAVLLGLSTAILTSLSIATGAYRPGKQPALPHSALSVALTFLLAASLTFGGIATAHGGWGSGPAGDSTGKGGQSKTPVAQDLPSPPEDNPGVGGDFPGVILLPELGPYPTIFVPVMPSPTRRPGLALRPSPKALHIPFSGEYWMYRWPAVRPPRRSIIRRGSATDLSFHTTDGWPMEMEAHQKLDSPIGTKCCSQMQLAIRSTDQHPESLRIELILIDTSAPAYLALTLGTAAVGPAASVEQMLSFRVPDATAIHQFDELKIVFHRDRLRADKSARVAILRFVLVP